MNNEEKMIDYFFKSQSIELTEFHEREEMPDCLMFVDTREKKSNVINHQIIRFRFEDHFKSEVILRATVAYIYENGTKSGMTFNNEAIVERMKLGQKCVSVLDQLNIKHYYPAMYFTVEMNTVDNIISVTNCYQNINILSGNGPSYCLLEDIVINIINRHFKEWDLPIENIELSDLIDMYLMAKI
jgi:hypothetical protein